MNAVLIKIQLSIAGLFPIWGVSAVSAALNTPIVKHMFRQGPDHISAHCSPAACELWENTRRSIPPVAYLGVGAGQRGFVWRGTMTGWLNYHTLDQMDRLFIRGRWINKKILQQNTPCYQPTDSANYLI